MLAKRFLLEMAVFLRSENHQENHIGCKIDYKSMCCVKFLIFVSALKIS